MPTCYSYPFLGFSDASVQEQRTGKGARGSIVQTRGRLIQGSLVSKLARIERAMTIFERSDIGSLYFESGLPSGIRRPIQSTSHPPTLRR